MNLYNQFFKVLGILSCIFIQLNCSEPQSPRAGKLPKPTEDQKFIVDAWNADWNAFQNDIKKASDINATFEFDIPGEWTVIRPLTALQAITMGPWGKEKESDAIKIINELIKNEADPNIYGVNEDFRPIYLAVEYKKSFPIFKALVDNGADLSRLSINSFIEMPEQDKTSAIALFLSKKKQLVPISVSTSTPTPSRPSSTSQSTASAPAPAPASTFTPTITTAATPAATSNLQVLLQQLTTSLETLSIALGA